MRHSDAARDVQPLRPSLAAAPSLQEREAETGPSFPGKGAARPFFFSPPWVSLREPFRPASHPWRDGKIGWGASVRSVPGPPPPPGVRRQGRGERRCLASLIDRRKEWGREGMRLLEGDSSTRPILEEAESGGENGRKPSSPSDDIHRGSSREARLRAKKNGTVANPNLDDGDENQSGRYYATRASFAQPRKEIVLPI